jgi:signal peptidase I
MAGSGAAPGAAQHSTESKLFRDIVETMLLVAISFLVVNALIGRFRIEQVSMQPNLHEGEYVIVDKVSYALRTPERGEIVVLKSPTPGAPDLIKRVVGLPGEMIEVRDGQAYVNGTPLTEPYINGPIAQATPPRLVEDGRYFVMGDNRNNSSDSRLFGTIPAADIVGRAWIIYWPPSDWQILSDPTYAAASPP